MATKVWMKNAIVKGDENMIRNALESNDGEDWRAENLDELLQLAMQNGRFGIAKALLTAGADVNAEFGKYWTTLLHDYVQFGEYEAVNFLIGNGAKINAVDSRGSTPLHNARNAECAQLLIRNGADIHCKDRFGATPLHNATKEVTGMQPRSEVAMLLVESGADIHLASVRTVGGAQLSPLDDCPSELRGALIAASEARSLQAATLKIQFPSPKKALERLLGSPQQEVAPRARRL